MRDVYPDSAQDAADRVTAVVPVHDDVANLTRCLDALADCRPGVGKVVVVDDASPEPAATRTRLLCESRAGVELLRLNENVGPAVARNRGAAAADSPVVWFVDADCEAAPDAAGRVAATLAEGSPYDATFGSYDDAPADRHLVSVWKNLAHRHTHQVADPEARTFWSGCGAARREVFQKFGGFDEGYGRPCIEDIELGMRMAAAGHRIRLDRDLQVKHRKRWTLWKLLKTDLFDRAIPWTRAMRRQPVGATNDLNLKTSQKASALLIAAAAGLLLLAAVLDPRTLLVPAAWLIGTLIADVEGRLTWPAAAVAVGATAAFIMQATPAAACVMLAVAAVLIVVALNWSLYRLIASKLDLAAAVLSVVPHGLHFGVALVGFAVGRFGPAGR